MIEKLDQYQVPDSSAYSIDMSHKAAEQAVRKMDMVEDNIQELAEEREEGTI